MNPDSGKAPKFKQNYYLADNFKQPSTMYLFFDVEAAGKPKKWKSPHTDTFNWPRMVQLAWVTCDENYMPIERHNCIIKPDGWDIPYESERIHKISPEIASEKGIPVKEALEKFAADIKEAKYVVAHNMNYCASVVGAEFIRASVNHRLFESEQYCTMRESTHFCKLPGKDGRLKWPSLKELHIKLFRTIPKGLNNAAVDAEVCGVCFFKLLELEAIDIF